MSKKRKKTKDPDEIDSYHSCVACGGYIPVRNNIPDKHECAKTHEAARKAADTRAYDDVPTRRNMSLADRLELGFELLSDDDIEDNDD